MVGDNMPLRESGGGGGEAEEAGYRIKNKNPTQRCGELNYVKFLSIFVNLLFLGVL